MRWVFHRAIGELAREHRVLERRLAPRQVARLARSLPRPRGLHGLGDHLTGVSGILLEELGELSVDYRFDQSLYRGIAELRLGLSLELRVVELDGHDCREPFANVLALET